MMTKMPSQIGRYRVLSTLGKGGFACVYLAEDPGLDVTVAIKILFADRAADLSIRERFINEARKMRDLSGPGLVVVHDISEHDGRPFFVMEHCERGNLEERLENLARPINLTEARGLARALATATSVVHKGGVVHRDLKPSNYLIRHRPSQSQPVVGELLAQDEELVIADFGLAKSLDSKSSRITLVGGTPGFGAPEQFRGDPNIDTQADVYSLSAILIAALSGEQPQAVLSSNDRAFSGKALDKSGTLRSALIQGLEFDPGSRQADASEWYETFSRPVAEPVLLSRPTRRSVFSRRFMIKTGSTALIGLGGAFAASSLRLLPGPRIIGPTEGSTGDEATFAIDDSKPATWTVSGRQHTTGRIVSISPNAAGTYTISVATTLGSTNHRYIATQPETDLRITGPGHAPVGQATLYTAEGAGTTAPTWTVGERTSIAETVEIEPDSVGPISMMLRGQNGATTSRTITAVNTSK